MLINAVFEGGGVRGIALAGAVRAAEESQLSFHAVAGTSSGAILAALICAGYTAAEMRDVILETPFHTFLQRSAIFNTKAIGPVLRLFTKKGLYSGQALEKWIRELLCKKGIVRFEDIPEGKLRIIASDITNGKLLVLPNDIAQYGEDPKKFSIARAIRMSASIPYFFDPVMISPIVQRPTWTSPIKPASYIVDGALLSNYPLWLFDRDRKIRKNMDQPTIGFQLVGKKEGQPHRIFGPITMMKAMVGTMLSAHDERYIEDVDRYRTVKIPTLGMSATHFNISPEESMALYDSGYQAGRRFFNQWSKGKYEEEFKKYEKESFS